MGVQDYRCSVCDTPTGYTCGEKEGKPCDESGIGDDKAVLDLFFFAEGEAPEDPGEFEAARKRARRVETLQVGYDWGAWEFVPSLNYRELLMDDEDSSGVWAVRPYEEGSSDGNAIDIDIPEGERVWVVNYCPPCRALFVDGRTRPEDACTLYLEAVAEGLELDFSVDDGADAKSTLVAAVREHVARRRPVAK